MENVKVCPKCHREVPAIDDICNCGYEFPASPGPGIQTVVHEPIHSPHLNVPAPAPAAVAISPAVAPPDPGQAYQPSKSHYSAMQTQAKPANWKRSVLIWVVGFLVLASVALELFPHQRMGVGWFIAILAFAIIRAFIMPRKSRGGSSGLLKLLLIGFAILVVVIVVIMVIVSSQGQKM